MTMTVLAVQNSVVTGLEETYSAANADGHSIANEAGDVILRVKNGSGADITLTFATPAKIAGLDIENPTCVVTLGEERTCGPFRTDVFNQVSGSLRGVFVTFSGVSSLTVAAIRVALP